MSDLFIVFWLSACFRLVELLNHFHRSCYRYIVISAIPKQMCVWKMPTFNQSLQWLCNVYWSTKIFAHESHLEFARNGEKKAIQRMGDRAKEIEFSKPKCRSFALAIDYIIVCARLITCRLKSIELKSSKATTVWKMLKGKKPGSQTQSKTSKNFEYCSYICFISIFITFLLLLLLLWILLLLDVPSLTCQSFDS